MFEPEHRHDQSPVMVPRTSEFRKRGKAQNPRSFMLMNSKSKTNRPYAGRSKEEVFANERLTIASGTLEIIPESRSPKQHPRTEVSLCRLTGLDHHDDFRVRPSSCIDSVHVVVLLRLGQWSTPLSKPHATAPKTNQTNISSANAPPSRCLIYTNGRLTSKVTKR